MVRIFKMSLVAHYVVCYVAVAGASAGTNVASVQCRSQGKVDVEMLLLVGIEENPSLRVLILEE